MRWWRYEGWAVVRTLYGNDSLVFNAFSYPVKWCDIIISLISMLVEFVNIADVMLSLLHWHAMLLLWLKKIKQNMNFEKFAWRNFRYFYKLVRNWLYCCRFFPICLCFLILHPFLHIATSCGQCCEFCSVL